MAESCSLKAHIKNSNGEVVESKLFNDLLHYTSDRGLTKEYYAVGTDKQFLEKVGDQAKFDQNGEITFQSLRKLANINIGEDKELNTLNKDIGAGTYEYSEAMGRLQSFNRQSQYNDKYMATVVSNSRGQYELQVVKKTAANEALLDKEISNRTLQDRIIYHLNKLGVDVSFIENDEKINGKYSTKNAKQTAEGLYQLVQIANGKSTTSALAEEAGHFVIGSLGNSPLVQRLTSLLTPEVQKQIVGQEYDSKYLGDNSAREIAGQLVGKALEGSIDQETPWNKLAHRIANAAKRIFYSLKGDQIAKDAMEAEKIANDIAKGFMSPNFQGNVENALETKETLYSSQLSFNVKTYRQVTNRLKLQASEMKSISEDLFKKFNNIVGQVEMGRNINAPSMFADASALEGIAEAVSLVSDLMQSEIPSLLESVDFTNESDFATNMPRNAKALRAVRTYARNALALINIINEATSSLGAQALTGDKTRITVVDSQGNSNTYNLLDMSDNLDKLLRGRNGIISELRNKESQFFLKFLEGSMGQNYVYRAARRVFNWKKGKKLLEYKDAERINLQDAMEDLESDITIFERWFGSMANNSDIIGQLADKTVKLANKMADDLTNQAQNQLRVLQSQLKDIGLSNTDIFCEKSARTGKLTGNMVSEHCWGDYEDDWIKFKRECKDDFFKQNPNLDGKSDFEKAIMWDSYFRPKVKDWHRANSIFDKVQGRYVPNSLYDSEQYKRDIESHPERVRWLMHFMELKRDLDSRLPDGTTNEVRMPQFKGTFTNKIRNKGLFESATKATIGTIKNELAETFCESSEDTDFGSNQTYNTLEEDIFQNKLAFEKEKLNRLPIYGVNKLVDTSQLSTDLFHSMFAYAGMANTYAALNQVVDTLEVGKEVLNRRRVSGIIPEQEAKINKSRAYNRYLKFLDKQVYGISTKKITITHGIVLNKIASSCSGLASKIFLGGNVAGGLVNVGTGFNEILKEGLASEHFNLNDLARANKVYFENLPSNLWDAGAYIKENKVSLFMRHFNSLGNSREAQRGWTTRKKRLTHLFYDESLFMPYKCGEHYMESMAYLALAQHVKVYDEDGNRISLYNAYQVSDNEDEFGMKDAKYGKTLELKGTFFKHKGDIDKHNMITSIVEQINNSLNSSSPFGAPINLTQEQEDYLKQKGYNIADLENVKQKLLEEDYKLTWTVDDESSFMDKAREINDRMHGIYNNQDRVAFQQSIYGNALMAMKGYALGMAERRFGVNKHNTMLNGESEGSLRTAAKVIVSMFTDKGGWKTTIKALLLPVINPRGTKLAMYKAGFSANQYANMRRNFGDMLLIGLFALIKMATAKSDGADDDEDDDVVSGICYYFASRLYREQSAYNQLNGAVNEAQNLVNGLLPAGMNVLQSLGQLAYLWGGSQINGDTDDSEFYYQSSKEGVYQKGDPKWESKFFRMFPYLRSSYVFEHPYDAAKSFDYGRVVKAQ